MYEHCSYLIVIWEAYVAHEETDYFFGNYSYLCNIAFAYSLVTNYLPYIRLDIFRLYKSNSNVSLSNVQCNAASKYGTLSVADV